MPVFKTFWKVLYRNLVSILVYSGIFFLIAASVSFSEGSGNPSDFTARRLKLAIIDRDGSTLSFEITRYLFELHDSVPLENDAAAFQDALFQERAEFILIIPSGFEQGFLDDGPPALQKVDSPNSTYGAYATLELESLLGMVRSMAISTGSVSYTDLFSQAEKYNRIDTPVSFPQDYGSEDPAESLGKAPHAFYYRFLSYALLAVMLLAFVNIMFSFERTEIRNRMLCSSITLRSQYLQFVAAGTLLALSVWLIYNLAGLLLYRSTLLHDPMFPYYLLNSFAYTLVSVSLSLVLGFLIRTRSFTHGIINIVTLAFSFLGGAFVPLEAMNRSVLLFSRFTPTYWNIRAHGLISNTSVLTGTPAAQFRNAVYLQLLFAAAFLSIALLLAKRRAARA